MTLKIIAMELEGFRSWARPATITFENAGLVHITGSNGAGKTSIVEALVWCLFGQGLKAGRVFQTYEHMRPKGWRGTRVLVHVSLPDGRPLTVARHINFSTGRTGHKSALVVHLDGEELLLGKRDAQRELELLLGITREAFIRAIVLPQRAAPLLGATGVEQRAALDALFDLGWLQQAKDRALDLYREAQQATDQANAVFAETRQRLEFAERELRGAETMARGVDEQRRRVLVEAEAAKSAAAAEVETFRLRRAALNEELTRLVARQAQLEAGMDKFDGDPRVTLARLHARRSGVAARLQHAKSAAEKARQRWQVAFSAHADAIAYGVPSCPTCGNPLTEAQVAAELSRLGAIGTECEAAHGQAAAELAAVEAAALDLEADIVATRGLASKMTDLERAQFEVDEAARELASLAGLFEMATRRLDETTEMVAACQAEPPGLDVDFGALRRQVADAESDRDEAVAALQLVTERQALVQWWSTTGFGAKGLRAFIIERQLALVNTVLPAYIGALGMSLRLRFDAGALVADVMRAGVPADYGDLSGGEQQRLELALTLALHDAVTSLTPVNLLFLDESMTNVDPAGAYQLFELLRAKPRSAVFIMTFAEVDAVGLRELAVANGPEGSYFV